MGFYVVTGFKVYIGGITGSGPAEWVEIGGLLAMGTLESTGEISTYLQIDPEDPDEVPRVRKIKASRDGGTMELVCAQTGSDAGQVALAIAEVSGEAYDFRVVLPDARPGGSPSERRFSALVAGAGDVFDDANNVFRFAASLAIDSEIIRIAAT